MQLWQSKIFKWRMIQSYCEKRTFKKILWSMVSHKEDFKDKFTHTLYMHTYSMYIYVYMSRKGIHVCVHVYWYTCIFFKESTQFMQSLLLYSCINEFQAVTWNSGARLLLHGKNFQLLNVYQMINLESNTNILMRIL